MTAPTRRIDYGFVWPWLAFLFFALDVGLLFVARPVHQAVFEGELGVVELPTFLFLLAAVPFAVRGAVRTRGSERVLFVLLALGCLFWGGEEVDWGQTFVHWATPAAWSKGNYQHEMNLHNERGVVGTLLNVVPRFILLVLTIVSLLLNLPIKNSLRTFLARRFSVAWVDRLAACWVPATLAIAAAVLNKIKPLGYRDYGETQELFTAVFLFQFTILQYRARFSPDAAGTLPACSPPN